MGNSANPMQVSTRNASPNPPESNRPKAAFLAAIFRETGAGIPAILAAIALTAAPVHSQPASQPAAAAVGAPASVSTASEAAPVVTLVFNQGEIEAIAESLATKTARQIDVFGKAKGTRVDVIAKDRPLEEALDMVTAPAGLVWWQYDTRKYAIADSQTYADMTLREPDFDAALKHLTVKYHCIPAKDPAGAIRVILPPLPQLVRCGPGTVARALGVDPDPVSVDEAAAKEAQKVTLVFKQGKIEQVVMALSQQAQAHIRLRGGLQGQRVDVIVKEQPTSQALDAICAGGSLVWWQTINGDYGLSPRAFFEKNVLGNEQLETLIDIAAQSHGRVAKRISEDAGGWVYELIPQTPTPTQPPAADSKNPAITPKPSAEAK